MQIRRNQQTLEEVIRSLYNVKSETKPQNNILHDTSNETPFRQQVPTVVNHDIGTIKAVRLIKKFDDFMNRDNMYMFLCAIIVVSIILLLCILNHRTYKILRILQK